MKVLVIGGGPIKVGHACEFDYSGTQVCQALKEEDIFTILINSNPATFMTSRGTADEIIFDTIKCESVARLINEYKPDAILAFAGGQVALNTVKELFERYKFDIQVLGTSAQCIRNAEDRTIFKHILSNKTIDCLKSFTINRSFNYSSIPIAYPIILRTSYTLGGSYSRVVQNTYELKKECEIIWKSIGNIEIFAEEYIAGWQEFEFEMIKDLSGHCHAICYIENITPMGVHTGDSVTVSPAFSLSNVDCERMYKMACVAAEGINFAAGSFNVQFAKNPINNRIVMIEINPRLSRSSALASKVTGIPIARVAVKLALGYSISEINDDFHILENSVTTRGDYVSVKIPVFQMEKINRYSVSLRSYMQSIGEAVGVGRDFKEAFLKGIQGAEGEEDTGLLRSSVSECSNRCLVGMLRKMHFKLFFAIAEALRRGLKVSQIVQLTRINAYFVNEIKQIIDLEKKVRELRNNTIVSFAKSAGFSDSYICALLEVDSTRLKKFSCPKYVAIDKFNDTYKYLYSTHKIVNYFRAKPLSGEKIIIIGSGPNKIGQGLEFDYCCVHASLAVKMANFKSIMVNCNPATVSTDYTISDRLYLEPITFEHILDIIKFENPYGVLLQFGGQSSLLLAENLYKNNIKILGSQYKTIDITENRAKFRSFLIQHKIFQPLNLTASNLFEAEKAVKEMGYPVILRPSYVIGGKGIKRINNSKELRTYFLHTSHIDVLVEKFIENATEVDVDAICDGSHVVICGIMQQIEPSGIHSGDSAAITPPFDLTDCILNAIKKYTYYLGNALKILGFFNVQFLIKNDEIFVVEVNARASRTIPFISKAMEVNFVKYAVDACLGERINIHIKNNNQQYALKLPVFSYFPGVNIVKGEEMRSTGEEMFLDEDVRKLFYKIKYNI